MTSTAETILPGTDAPRAAFTPARASLLDPIVEPPAHRTIFLILALITTLGFYLAVMSFWTPFHPGVDQNGYLYGGRQIARTLDMKVVPLQIGMDKFDPFQFVGRMWVGVDYGTEQERFYPKYPIGLPAIYALTTWIGDVSSSEPLDSLVAPFTRHGEAFGVDRATTLTYMVSPLCATVAVFATFLAARLVCGSFIAWMVMLAVACSATTMGLANNPNSHASCLFFVTVGIYLLLKWHLSGGAWRAALGGAMVGYATTIRYTEATLFLVVVLIAVFSLEWRRVRSWAGLALAIAGWVLPVALLAAYNLAAMGSTTGYDPTNESTGFRWEYARDNWDTMFRNLAGPNGLFAIFPIGMVGLCWMFVKNWRLALVMSAWIVPCMMIYTFYYWAPDGTSVGYLRFFLTIYPAVAICAGWLAAQVLQSLPTVHLAVRTWKIAAIVLVAAVGFVFAGAMKGAIDPTPEFLDANPTWGTTLESPSPSTMSRVYASLAQAPELLRAGLVTSRWDQRVPRVGVALAVACGAAVLMSALLFGRAAAARWVVATLVVISSAVQLDWAMFDLENDGGNGQVLRLAWLGGANEVASAVPEGSVLFASDANYLHFLQYTRDYIFYQPETFVRGWVWNQANAAIASASEPQGLDPGRAQALWRVVEPMNDAQLDERARSMIRAAHLDGRRVFLLLPRRENESIPRVRENRRAQHDLLKRLAPAEQFDSVVASAWNNPLPRPPVPNERFRPRGRRTPQVLNRAQTLMQLIEILPKSTPTDPRPRPDLRG